MKKIITTIVKIKLSITVLFLIVALMIFMFLGLRLGFAQIDSQEILSIIVFKFFHIHLFTFDTNSVDIIWDLRFPRILLSACVGMGLTLSGVIVQAIVRNPLADPYILGISSGASLGAACAIFLGAGIFFGGQAIGLASFIGAVLVSLLVLLMSKVGGKNNTVRLLLSGIAMNAVCSGCASFVVYLGKDKTGMEAIKYWLMGTVANAKLGNVVILLFLVLLMTLFFCTQIRILNLLLIGNESAITLGINLQKYICCYLVLNGLLVGFIVFNSGTIGFIGLIIPHFVRLIYGANHKKLLPVAVVFGGVITVIADIISRTLIPTVELPIGVIFSFIGAPAFIYLMIQKRYLFGGNG